MSIKILLADDSITIQKVVGIIFGGDEYSLTVVDNGKAAVEKARELNPDVLLIDVLMPGMSGYDVCEAVRAIPSIATKPILLLTGSFEPFDEARAKKCGADEFLSKPFESQQIITKVKELIEMGSSQRTVSISDEQDTSEFSAIPEVTKEPSIVQDIWDTFDVPSEEPTLPPALPVLAEESTGSQWVPVKEETFAFEDKITEEQTTPVIDAAESSIEERILGDTGFGSTSELSPISKTEPVTFQPAELVSVQTPAALTEEQIRQALASVSKDVIERIVWEVVPDLAEVLIKEAIRKIKEGQ